MKNEDSQNRRPIELLPLPAEPFIELLSQAVHEAWEKQMRLYAIECIEADRAGRGDMVWVPREPTPAMIEAGRAAIKIAPDLDGILSENTAKAWNCYRAMLAAAPQPAQPERRYLEDHDEMPCPACGNTVLDCPTCDPADPRAREHDNGE